MKVLIQFKINDIKGPKGDGPSWTWEVNASELDGQPMPIYGLADDLYQLYIANK